MVAGQPERVNFRFQKHQSPTQGEDKAIASSDITKAPFVSQ